MRQVRCGLLLLLSLILPCVQSATPDETLLEAVRTLAAKEHIPALALALKLPHRPVQTAAVGAGIHTGTPFRFGSITKSFTAIALLQAASIKGVPFDAPLDTVIPRRHFTNRFTQRVTLFDLVALTAGHTDIGMSAFNDNTAYPLAQALDINREALTSMWPPGLLHSYTNATPGLSALAIEQLTGESWEVAMQTLLFTPMGLRSATFEPPAALPGGFRADGITPIPYWNVTFRAFGGLNLSMDDMAVFLDVLLNGGHLGNRQIWSPGIHARLVTPAPSLATRAGLQIGYGAGVYSRLRLGRLWHGHGGDADGYRSRYAFLPGEDAGYAVVINTDNPTALSRLERIIEARIVADLAAGSVRSPVTQPARTGLDGTFYPATVRFGTDQWVRCGSPRLHVRTRGDTLFLRFADRRRQLHSLDGLRFVNPGETDPVIALHRDDAGVVWLVGEFGNYVRIRERNSRTPATVPAFLPACVTE